MTEVDVRRGSKVMTGSRKSQDATVEEINPLIKFIDKYSRRLWPHDAVTFYNLDTKESVIEDIEMENTRQKKFN